jgi:hypothetical protein
VRYVRLPEFSEAAAADALVELWCRLEEYGLPSPELTAEFAPNGRVRLSLLFRDPAHVAPALKGWGESFVVGEAVTGIAISDLFPSSLASRQAARIARNDGGRLFLLQRRSRRGRRQRTRS